MSTKGKSASTRKGGTRAAGRKAPARKPAAKKATARRSPARKTTARNKGDAHGPVTWLTDVLLLAGLAAALFTGIAVFRPSFSQPFGRIVHDGLYAALGAGMYLAPAVAALIPLALLPLGFRRTLLKALAWAACLLLLVTLFAGLWQAGGVVGDAAARLGGQYLSGFYPVLLGAVALAVIIRLAGRSLLIPLARGTYRAAATTADTVREIGAAVKEEADSVAGERAKRAAEREERRKAVLAAELEAADAPEGDSPVVRGEDKQTEHAAADVPAIRALGDDYEQPAYLSSEDAPRIEPLPIADPDGPADEFAAAIEQAGKQPASGNVPPPDGTPEPEPEAQPTGDQPAHADAAEDTAAATTAAQPATGRGAALEGVRNGDAVLAAQAQAQSAAADGQGQLVLFGSTQAGYELPPLELLRDVRPQGGEAEFVAERTQTIEQLMANFNIEAQVVNAITGPRVTRFELTVGPGINVSKLHGLSDNLAYELGVKAVRIETPVPGKKVCGIEVPNAQPDLVTLKSVLLSSESKTNNHPLTVGIGRDIGGTPVIATLSKMPHLLVAGATGSGKSVCLNAIIVSLLMRNAPDTLRLMLIDPKRVEMTSFSGVPHLACPIVHDVAQAQSALKWAAAEMDRRYRLLESARARNIGAYNGMVEEGRQLPYLVIVVDELADLMMLAGQAIEKLICRIAQLARAVGIHLVIATQRPDVKVITGTIKANIPSRIAFSVVSHVDSRTILDGSGADKLLGSGDMLFAPIGENIPLRVQGAFLSDDEIDRVVDWCRQQGGGHSDDSIISFDESGGAGGGIGGEDADELLGEAREIVTSTNKASISYLQRRLKIGYNRAANLMEELETAGIVSAPDNQGNRKVL